MRWARSIALVALIAAGAVAVPEERSHVSLVPWKVVSPDEAVDAPLILFWVPSSRDELRRSPLLTSDELTRYSSRCVAMRVVRSDDAARLQRLNIESDLPVVVLTDRDGRVLGTVESEHGALTVGDVEELVQDELDARVTEAEMRLDEAHRHAENGDDEIAQALYRAVWAERCMCPRQGKAAQRALKRMEKR
jgi:hypothetical protein